MMPTDVDWPSRVLLTLGLIALCASPLLAQNAADHTIPGALAAQTPAAPTVDGVLDESEWDDAAAVAGFSRVGTEHPASQPTAVRLLFDDRALYIGFICHEPNPDELAHSHTGPDADVWFDDSVEVFIDPGHSHERYFQFALNCVGATFDRHMENIAWTADWRVGTTIGDNRWTAEIAIPFEALGCAPAQPGDVFAANFCRNRKTSTAGADEHGEWSSWAPVQSQYHEPERFGHILFVETPQDVALQTLAELAANPLCTDGRPLTRSVELAVQSGVVRYAPHRAQALSELTGEQSAVTSALTEIANLLASDRWDDEATRDTFAQRHATLQDYLERLREKIGEGTDAVALQHLRVQVGQLREKTRQLLWDTRFELLFAGLEGTETTN